MHFQQVFTPRYGNRMSLVASGVAATGILNENVGKSYRVSTTGACNVVVRRPIEEDPSSTTGMIFGASEIEYIYVPAGHEIAVYAGSGASGNFYWTPMELAV